MQDERGSEAINHRIIDRGWNRFAKRAVFRIAHDSDDFFIGFCDAIRPGISESLAKRIPAREEFPRESLIDNHLLRLSRIAVEPVERSARKQAHAHACEITRSHLVQAAVQKVGS